MHTEDEIMNLRIKSYGFSLIEVLVALVVLSLGMIGLAKFQGTLISNASDSRYRTEAVNVAEEQIETFRSNTGIDNYEAQILAQTYIVSNDVDYTVTVGVTDCYGDGADQGACLGEFGTTQPVGWKLGASTHDQMYKLVTVDVSWTSPKGGDENIELNTIIESISNFDTDLPPSDGDTSATGGESATTEDIVRADEPEIEVDTTGDGVHRQTSKPLPEVFTSGNDQVNTMVSFDVLTYRHVSPGSTEIEVEQREEFITLSCQCDNYQSTGSTGYTSAHVQWNEAGSDSYRFDSIGSVVSKPVATGSSNNATDVSGVCDICCRDHHDSALGVRYDGQMSGTSSDHTHYTGAIDATSGIPIVATDGDSYVESCRFKRIDGLFRVFQDWQAVDINTLPHTELITTSLEANYSTYIENFLKISTNVFPGSPTRPSDADIVTPSAVGVGELKQYQSRVLYVDNVYNDSAALSNGATESYKSYVIDTSNLDALEKIPFAELNATLLSDWDPADVLTYKPYTVAADVEISVTDDLIDTVSSTGTYYSNFYSRGRLTGIIAHTAGASSPLYSSIEKSNSGLTDFYDDNLSATEQIFDIALYDNLGAVQTGTNKLKSVHSVSVSGTATLINVQGPIVVDFPAVKGKTPSVSLSSSAGTCSLAKVTGTEVYDCVIPSGTISFTITPSSAGYVCTQTVTGNPVNSDALEYECN